MVDFTGIGVSSLMDRRVCSRLAERLLISQEELLGIDYFILFVYLFFSGNRPIENRLLMCRALHYTEWCKSHLNLDV
jgi:hypothetical protein